MPNLTHTREMAEKLEAVEESSSSKALNPTPSKLVVLADLNVDPPEADDDDSSLLPPPQITRFLFIFIIITHPHITSIYFIYSYFSSSDFLFSIHRE